MNTMKWLVKREFWEHKGGFFWAPVIAAGIYLAISIFGFALLELGLRNGHVQMDGGGINMNEIARQLSDPAKAQEVHSGVQAFFYVLSAPPLIALIFVVFFYCVGNLYDERKDRSILFWKSLPVSDRDTVLSKVISASFVAPGIAFAVTVLTGLAAFAIISAVVILHGHNPLPLWDLSAIFSASTSMLLSIPMYALWALPTLGWLMLCSAWANRVPFLWATLSPVFLGIIIAIADLMRLFNLSNAWYWANIPGRLLLGTVPGMEMIYRYNSQSTSLQIHGPEEFARLFSISNTYAGLANPQLWIGVVAGIGMILVAMRLRRHSNEG